jgi:signal transduction histidine kinase/ligand-binding sensor domain-containing protein
MRMACLHTVSSIPVLLLFAASTRAQPRGKVEYYSTEQGLSDQRVTTILKDREGFMWFGTWDGINRFDGHSFVSFKSAPEDHYQIGNERIDEMVEDQTGHLWVSAYDGEVYRFDKKKEVFFPLSAILYPANYPGRRENVIFKNILGASNGLVWLKSSEKGLYCFSQTDLSPGHFQHFHKEAPPICRLPSNTINFLHEDRDHRVWVGTSQGLCCLKKTDSGTAGNSGIVPADIATRTNVTAFDEDAGQLYFSTEDGRLIIFEKRAETFSVHRLTTGRLYSLYRSKKIDVLYATGSDGEVIIVHLPDLTATRVNYSSAETFNTLYEDGTGALWIEPEKKGAIRFDPSTQAFQLFSFDSRESLYFIGNRYHVLEDNSGTVWVNMKGGGFGYYSALTKQIEYVLATPDGKNYQFPPIVYGVYYDANSILWLKTNEWDLVKIVLQQNNFRQLLLAKQDASPSENEVRGIFYDRQGRLWLGAKRGDLFVYRNNVQLKGLFVNPPPGGLDRVYSILQDRHGNVWLGTKDNGLFKATPVNREETQYRLTHFLPDKNDPASLPCNEIYALLEDKQGIWIGSYDNGLSLIADDGHATRFIHGGDAFRNYPKRAFQKIRHMALDKEGNLWIGTTNGLLVQGHGSDPSGAFAYKSYSNTSAERERLINNDIQFIHRDRKGRMWLATSGGGLSLAVGNQPLQTLQFRNYTTRDGMPNDYILGCAEDKTGDLWLSTENGIVRFDPETRAIRNYDSYDGLSKVYYSEASVCTNASGDEVVFGTRHGYITFDPGRINTVPIEANLAFTNLQINNEDVGPGKNETILDTDINYVSGITLRYDQNIVSIDYGVLDPRAGNRQATAYRLVGFDTTWHNDRQFRRATYTNLPPGQYVFEVKALSPDLYTNQPYKRLSIVIRPPWWKTGWAYALYSVAAAVLLYFIRRNAVDKIRLRNKIVVEKRLAQLKMNFFTNISHELRTPLTLIAGPLEQLSRKGNLSPEESSWVDIARRNADRTVRFVNQLLDLRKAQSDNATLHLSRIEVVDFVRRIGDHFSEAAESKHIALNVNCDRQELPAWADAGKLDVVIYNLLSNAIKFTPRGKTISIHIESPPGEAFFYIRVQDQGPGVPKEQLEEIFELFREAAHPNERELNGTGIGLALCREFVTLHDGVIWAENNADGGLTITVKLRQGMEHFKRSQIAVVDPPGPLAPDEAPATATFHDAPATIFPDDPPHRRTPLNGGPGEAKDPAAPLVLLVEDHEDLRTFIEGQLNRHFRVVTAADGEDGWKKANELAPDLVVSDIMMP